MHYRLLVFVASVFLITALSPQTPTLAAPSSAPSTSNDAFAYFPETGHNIGLDIKHFYDAHGGVDIFGLPLTEVFVEDDMQVQYFERARFEIHPDLPREFRVSLTRLGAYFTQGRTEPAFQWLSSNPDSSRQFFPESGHTLGGAFLNFWQTRGDLAVFGYPVSEELVEINPFDGQPYTAQYFERVRLEYHPAHAGTPYEVQISHLGRQFLDQRPEAQLMTPPVPPLELLGQATTGYVTSAEERVHNIEHSANMFDGVVVASGEEYSFLNSGDFNVSADFVEGYAIVGGELERVIGGGLCQVSTTMFRAVANAGLDITHRQGHTFVVNFYENILGFDATVFSPSVDFRWRNDTPGAVYMATSTNAANATVTFQIWGTSDGRTTTYEGPFVKNVVQPSVPTWQYDSTMAAGQSYQMVHGRAGMEVNYVRSVRMPDGSAKHYDNFHTRYQPWEDHYMYGPGVQPPAGVNVVGQPPATQPPPTQPEPRTPRATGGSR